MFNCLPINNLFFLIRHCCDLDFTDNAEFWTHEYELDDFRPQMEHLWKQIKPLYLQIHAFVRKRLVDKYGTSVISKTGPIPAHLLSEFDPLIAILMVRLLDS